MTKTWKTVFGVICPISLIFLSGCFIKEIRTIYVPDGGTVRLRQDVKGVKIWAKDGKGEWVPGQIDLKSGWYVKADSKHENKDEPGR